MKAIIQRVKCAEVKVDGQLISRIDRGILTLLGIAKGDDESKLRKLLQKITDLRIFEDQQGKMNFSLKDIQGSHLIVSQFTLLGDCDSGRRPSFIAAERPEIAKPLYELSLKIGNSMGIETLGGVFQSDMEILLINDGPVTFALEV